MFNKNKADIRFAEDPAEALRLYNERGYHIEPEVFSAAECQRLIAAGKDLAAKGDGTFRPLMSPHRVDALFLRTMADKRLTTIIQQLCGGAVHGLQSELFFGWPGTPGFAAHQDNFFVEAPEGAFVSAWTALVDVSPANGGLVMYPGSHRYGVLPVEKLSGPVSPNQDPNAGAQRSILPEGHAAGVDLYISQGSVIFLHSLVVHSSHDNGSDKWRHALLNTYIRQGAPFRSGNYARRSPIDLSTVTA